MITDIKTYKQRGAHEVKAKEFLSAWIAEHPTFNAIDAVKHFRARDHTT